MKKEGVLGWTSSFFIPFPKGLLRCGFYKVLEMRVFVFIAVKIEFMVVRRERFIFAKRKTVKIDGFMKALFM